MISQTVDSIIHHLYLFTKTFFPINSSLVILTKVIISQLPHLSANSFFDVLLTLRQKLLGVGLPVYLHVILTNGIDVSVYRAFKLFIYTFAIRSYPPTTSFFNSAGSMPKASHTLLTTCFERPLRPLSSSWRLIVA